MSASLQVAMGFFLWGADLLVLYDVTDLEGTQRGHRLAPAVPIRDRAISAIHASQASLTHSRMHAQTERCGLAKNQETTAAAKVSRAEVGPTPPAGELQPHFAQRGRRRQQLRAASMGDADKGSGVRCVCRACYLVHVRALC